MHPGSPCVLQIALTHLKVLISAPREKLPVIYYRDYFFFLSLTLSLAYNSLSLVHIVELGFLPEFSRSFQKYVSILYSNLYTNAHKLCMCLCMHGGYS